MATELAQAYVQIIPSAKGISGALQKEIDPEANAAGQSGGSAFASVFKKAIAAAAIGATVGKIFKDSIGEGSQLQQSLGGVETLFKDSADTVKNFANEAYRTTGLSANAYMENVTGFSASLLQSMGGDTEKAAKVADMAMIDMSDNANKMGTDMGSIQTAYQGFAKQNYTMLDNLKLGYGGTKEEMARLLEDATKLTGVKYDMSNLSDVYSAIHAVQEELGITGTTAKEASETFAGSAAAMKAAYQNVLGKMSLGQDISNDLKALAETTSTFIFSNLLPMIGNIATALPGAIATFIQVAAPQMIEAGKQLLTQISNGITTGLPTFVESLQSIITSIFTWITTNLPSLLETGVQILTNIANGILQAIPQIITVAGNLISTFVTFIMTNLPVILEMGKNLLLNLVDGIIANLPAVGASAIQAVSNFIDTIVANYPQYIQTGWNILLSLVKGILERLPTLITAAVSLVRDFVEMLISKIPSIVSAGIKMIIGLASGVLKSLPDILSATDKIGSTIINEIKSIDLMAAGRAIIDGFLAGLKSSWGAVTDFVGGIASWIAANKGPIEYDRKLLIPAGNAIMQGLNKGLQDKFENVKSTVNGMASEIASSFDNPIDVVSGQLNNFKGKSIENAVAHSLAKTTSSYAPGQQDNSDNLLEVIIEILYQLLEKDPDILLDGDSVVEKLINRVSEKLEGVNDKAAGKKGFRRGLGY